MTTTNNPLLTDEQIDELMEKDMTSGIDMQEMIALCAQAKLANAAQIETAARQVNNGGGNEQPCEADKSSFVSAGAAAIHNSSQISNSLVVDAANALEASLKLWEADARLWPAADNTLKPLIERLRALLNPTGGEQ